MTDIWSPNNPGIDGLHELTSDEEAFIQNLAGLSYSTGDIIYYNGSVLTNLGIGSEDEVLQVSSGGVPEWTVPTKAVSIHVIEGDVAVTVADGHAYILIPSILDGLNLTRAQAAVVTAGTTNATTVMIHNETDGQDMLSGAISIASGDTVGTVGTINTSYDDVSTNDVLRIDVDTISTSAPEGLLVVLEFAP